MSHEKKTHQEENLQAIEGALTKSEQFIEKYQKLLIYGFSAIVVIIGLFFGYKKLIAEPREEKALAQMASAQNYFEQGNYKSALEGNATGAGFAKIADEYSSTAAGNIANFYAGICELNLGQFQKALDHLNSYSSDNMIFAPLAEGAKGDAYVELKQLDKAASAYMKAATLSDNNFTAPQFLFKAAAVYEEQGNWKDALSNYENVKENYPQSVEATDVDKYITRAKLNINK
ncbi:tetratricopeptide repeat protein [Acetobacteroides hydrogenigenes]|uniref:Tetratricopeptide repeat protein n=1 Tax=Acetobacteroides hydrogenigenes TaxID=979970 RepID=A0A4R2EK69_9BACT|nr:tetratricopeptide repeat protein [Acetobacteroides hydrogenigenes]TCN66794.1 tetratricopeptide repeat protein [Acetobacteroides hydrogenigenes]